MYLWRQALQGNLVAVTRVDERCLACSGLHFEDIPEGEHMDIQHGMLIVAERYLVLGREYRAGAGRELKKEVSYSDSCKWGSLVP